MAHHIINHEIALLKLWNHGDDRNSLRCFTSYLNGKNKKYNFINIRLMNGQLPHQDLC